MEVGSIVEEEDMQDGIVAAAGGLAGDNTAGEEEKGEDLHASGREDRSVMEADVRVIAGTEDMGQGEDIQEVADVSSVDGMAEALIVIEMVQILTTAEMGAVEAGEEDEMQIFCPTISEMDHGMAVGGRDVIENVTFAYWLIERIVIE